MNSKVENTGIETSMVPGSTPTSPATRPEKRRRLSSPTNEPEPPDATKGIEYVEARSVGTQCSRPLNVKICVVCNEDEAEHVFVPCGHRSVCFKCLSDATNAKQFQLGTYISGKAFHEGCLCPICRTIVREVVKVYE